MKATDILMEEHRVIERVLKAMEAAAQHLEAGRVVPPDFFLTAAEFVKGFADGCHHKKEEEVLFKALQAAGLSATSGPIAVMLAEHEQGRAYIRALRAAAEQWQRGERAAVASVVANARGYTTLLREHIAKEDGVLFPLANQIIAPAAQDDIAERFEHIEHEETGAGVHERYLALAETLERQVITL